MAKDTGVILLNLGGPDSLGAVKPFLYNLFSDREIIRLGPSFMQKPLAWLISTMRAEKTRKAYSLIGGKSPILDITKAQAGALEKELFAEGRALKVYIGMRYWNPFIEDALKEINQAGIKRLIAFNLYPHYSVATTGSSMRKFTEEIKKYPIEHHAITSWFDHPFYIEALYDLIKKGIASFGDDVPHLAEGTALLFSAHSLPQKFIAEGDPYVNEIKGTINAVMERLTSEGYTLPFHMGYQSKSGPVKWLEPSVEETLKRLSEGERVRRLLVVPISFVSDHIETLFEIDILYKEMAKGLGSELKRIESLNTHPVFISALKDLVLKAMKDKGWA